MKILEFNNWDEKVSSVKEQLKNPMYFKSEEEGNKFREWVNKYFPDWAKTNKLDASGEFDNKYIRKAWGEYGDIYNKLVNPTNNWNRLTKGDTKTFLNDLLKTEDLNKISSLITKHVNNELPVNVFKHRYSKHLYVEIDYFPDVDLGYFNLRTTIDLKKVSFKFDTKDTFTASATFNIYCRVPDGLFSGKSRTIVATPTIKGKFKAWEKDGKFYLSVTPTSLNINTNWNSSVIGSVAVKNNTIKWKGKTTLYDFGPYSVKKVNALSELNKATGNKFKNIEVDIDPIAMVNKYKDKIG